MAQINLEWHWIQWNSQDGFSTEDIEHLDLKRAVYVIRLNTPFVIEYGSSYSPVLYIGEGDLLTRLASHGTWIEDLSELVDKFGLSVAVSTPRVRNNVSAYRDVEAALLNKFKELFDNCLPLRNLQNEYQKIEHEYDLSALKEPLQIGKGNRYMWSIKPMKSNKFHTAYHTN